MKNTHGLMAAFGLACFAIGGLTAARMNDVPDVDRVVAAANAALANKPGVLIEKLCPVRK
jgi:hypothetical protein